eukprot:1137384-Amphidinium_carterae.1
MDWKCKVHRSMYIAGLRSKSDSQNHTTAFCTRSRLFETAAGWFATKADWVRLGSLGQTLQAKAALRADEIGMTHK